MTDLTEHYPEKGSNFSAGDRAAMPATESSPPLPKEWSKASFQQHFQTLLPLILAEWPQLSKDALLQTEGDLEQAIAHISAHTQQTRTLVQEHLKELATVAAKRSATLRSQTHAKVDGLVQDLEQRTEQLMQEFKSEILPELENKARSNIGSSLLMALGLGFILGLLVGGRRG